MSYIHTYSNSSCFYVTHSPFTHHCIEYISRQVIHLFSFCISRYQMSISLSCHNLVDHNLKIHYETFIKENFRRMIVLFIKFINFNYHNSFVH